MFNQITEIYEEYLEHLAGGGKRESVPHHKSRHSNNDLVYASSLGKCPLAAALRRLCAVEKFPLTREENLKMHHLMNQGIRLAELIQEAFLFHGDLVEEYFYSEDLGIAGVVDVLFSRPGEGHIIEIKTRNSEYPLPSLSDCYQALAYKYMLSRNSKTKYQAYILTLTPPNVKRKNDTPFDLWKLEPSGDGHIVVRHDGELWQSKFNDEERLNLTALKEEIQRHKMYLTGQTLHTPILDPLNDDGGWQCVKTIKKPVKRKTKPDEAGLIKRRCPYLCHTNNLGPYTTKIIDNKITTEWQYEEAAQKE